MNEQNEVNSDHELLQYAAKAAGYEKDWQWNVYWLSSAGGSVKIDNSWHKWNPLTDDGDAFRLAVKLGLRVGTDGQSLYPHIECWRSHYDTPRVFETCGEDPYAATRRAIVRAAAEIGRSMG
jgi:hypothetical protein